MKVKKARNSVSFVESLWSDGGSVWKKPASRTTAQACVREAGFFHIYSRFNFFVIK